MPCGSGDFQPISLDVSLRMAFRLMGPNYCPSLGKPPQKFGLLVAPNGQLCDSVGLGGNQIRTLLCLLNLFVTLVL